MAIPSAAPRLDRLHDPAPHVRLLGSPRYSLLVSGAGSGRSRCGGFALTRWNADRTEDGQGLFVYLRDLDSGAHWSFGQQPVIAPCQRYEVTAKPGALAITRRAYDIESTQDIAVIPEADTELRRLRLRNGSDRPRRIEITSCVEIALDHPGAAAGHPAFSKLFVQTAWDEGRETLLARRRPRAQGEHFPCLAHALRGPGALELESDRVRLLGRGGTLARPLALLSRAPLSGTTGSVLDPVFALRRTLVLPPRGEAELLLLLAAADAEDEALARAGRFALAEAATSAFDAAASWERDLLARLGLGEEQAAYLEALAGALLYGHPGLRAPADVIARARGRRADLGPELGSGRPLAIACVADEAGLDGSRDLIRARRYWSEKGVDVDLLLLCEGAESIHAEARALASEAGAVLWRRSEAGEGRIDLALACAALVVDRALPDLEGPEIGKAAAERWHLAAGPAARATEPRAEERLRFENGFGGFSEKGDEYVVRLAPDPALGTRRPPMPWVNVVANESFGFFASESGASCTWNGNSREHRLTPWHNDPVSDPHGEALYLRDEEAGVFWSPTPGPAPDGAPYEARHGFGASVWRHVSADLEQEVTAFVPRHDPVKLLRVRLRNLGTRSRRLSLFCHQRLVLGELAEESGRTVVTSWDAPAQTLLAGNGLAGEFAGSLAFAAAVAPPDAEIFASADRTRFLGRGGTPAQPQALREADVLDGASGARLDPCATLQLRCTLPAGGALDCVFLLGEATGEETARALVARYRAPGAVEAALREVQGFWNEILSSVRVESPLPGLDLLLNGWLAYQTLACRIWGRSAFYQSGGAFGFRDQLQDAAALFALRPAITRAQILLHAAHQFVEGDVLHWWHPPASRGTRTRFSDDLLWLPYLTAGYVMASGDLALLDERAGFRSARLLAPGEDEAYLETTEAAASATVYEHCCLALDRSLACGAHGLPLMGTGDWNDAMNRVGREGRGESVWVGFFLFAMLDDWAQLCAQRGDDARARRYSEARRRLGTALDGAAWDGAWYRRAWYDDGAVLGSAGNDECRIDALAQAWAVISGAAPPERAAASLDAAEDHLVSPEDGMIRLLTPPFDRTPHDPGYIKGYLPGIRENGGQYTHAALWLVRAEAEAGRRGHAADFLDMLTPVWHGGSAERVATYQVEPYVVAADLYGVAPHVGRGGWTWYTGSSGWMLRVALESLLGFTLEGGHTLVLRPRIPDTWPGFRLAWRVPEDAGTRYDIDVRNPEGSAGRVAAASLDGKPAEIRDGAARIALTRDGRPHRVEVALA